MRRYSTRIAAVAMLGCGLHAALPASAQDKNLGAAIAAKGGSGGAAACVSCHGAKGEGMAAAGFPRLAGLHPDYLLAQLDNFASGLRQNPVMAPIARQLTAAERKAVAGYFGGLPPPTPVASGDPNVLKASDRGAWLADRGRWDDNLPACVQCHGPGGAGTGSAFPPLAGQSSAYLAYQLHAFKSGARPGGPMSLMSVVAKRMTDADIAAVADHFGAAPADKGKK